ncbi:hypothetical protein CPC08DRAFT_198115 [Agrocybe pediades]|nr:hypothetical protein CPC08DRAFT_198115 [Agrocybe pediades]
MTEKRMDQQKITKKPTNLFQGAHTPGHPPTNLACFHHRSHPQPLLTTPPPLVPPPAFQPSAVKSPNRNGYDMSTTASTKVGIQRPEANSQMGLL